MPAVPYKSDAQAVAEIRALLPTTLGSAEIRDQIAAEIRANSVFVSRASNVVFLSRVKEVIDTIAAGNLDAASARLALLETLTALRYTPVGGFPDAPVGAVPPALAGTLQDLTSHRRLSLIVNTQAALVNGRGQQMRGMETERMKQFPAWELVRYGSRRMPRNWGSTQTGTQPRHHGQIDIRSRWTIAGGDFYGSRMIAFKGSSVWGELGASANYDDALDVDHPPFAFNSGMGWREVTRSECQALDVRGPDGETLAEWMAQDHPVMAAMPAPVISMRKAAPSLVSAMKKSTPTAITAGAATTPGNAARLAELQSRSKDRLAAAVARRNAEYESRPK